ncbi:MAG: S1/P1 Nuclease, partial [Chitinophagaceae bacterium]
MNIKRVTESKLKISIILLLVLSLPFRGLAWGVIGHRVIGEIASFHLSAKAKKEIVKILGTESLAMASNWADFYKSDPAYDYLYNWHFVNLPG